MRSASGNLRQRCPALSGGGGATAWRAQRTAQISTTAAPGSAHSTAISAETSSTTSLTFSFLAPVVDQALGEILVARDVAADHPTGAGERLAPRRQPQLTVVDPHDQLVPGSKVERPAHRGRDHDPAIRIQFGLGLQGS